MERARVLLAEDHVGMASELRALLVPAFHVVDVLANPAALAAACERLRPDVIVSDVAMPGDGGLAAIRHVHARFPTLPLVLLSVGDVEHLRRAGALLHTQVIVMKEDAGDELVPAVDAALAGRTYQSATARRLLRAAVAP